MDNTVSDIVMYLLELCTEKYTSTTKLLDQSGMWLDVEVCEVGVKTNYQRFLRNRYLE